MSRTLCLPREDSFLHMTPPVKEKHPDWQLVTCPVCGDGCYTSPDHEKTLALFPDMKAACTRYALRG